jgi:hypothetical protein
MTVRQVVWFIAGYLVTVAVAVSFNLAVLCQGDVKFDRGCGGFELYIPLWEIFLAPLPIAAILLELWRKSEPPPAVRLFAYLAGVVAVTEVGWLLLDTFPALLATQAVAIAIACLIRVKTAARGRRPPSTVA